MLSEWIFRERRLRDVERKLMAGDIRFPALDGVDSSAELSV